MDAVDQWANLHPDSLDEIAKRMFSYDDYVRLRHVCKQWNFLLPRTPKHRNPWLVLPFDETLFNTGGLEEKEIYHLRLPEIQNNFFRGSCHGYLIIVMISDGALQMLNPFTKSRFDLPPISTFPDIVSYDTEQGIYTLSCSRYGDYPAKKYYLHKTYLEKIITSSPPGHDDFMAVAIYGSEDRLAFCRSGDSGWTAIISNEKIDCLFLDVIFHEGKIYAINNKAGLYEFDMKTQAPLRGFRNDVEPPADLVPCDDLNHKYLVSCPNGGLLMVVRNLILFRHHEDEVKCCYRTHNFEMYIMNNEKKEAIWSRLSGLGKYALVLGFNSSDWMVPGTWHGKGNHIYYTDNQLVNHRARRVGDDGDDDFVEFLGGHDIGVMDVEDGINNRLFPNSDFLYPHPVWLSAIDAP